MGRLWTYALGIICALASVPSFPEGTVRLATEFQDIIPKYVVANGIESGISFEIMKYVESKGDFSFTYERSPVTLSRASADLESGVMDIQFGLQKTPEREKLMVFGPPLYAIKLVGAVRKADPASVISLAELVATGAVALTQRGTVIAARLKSIPKLAVDDGSPNIFSNLEKLAKGRGRVLLYHNLTLAYAIELPRYRDRFRIVDVDLGGDFDWAIDEQYLVYSKKVPSETVEAINRIMEAAAANGDLARITDKYLR